MKPPTPIKPSPQIARQLQDTALRYFLEVVRGIFLKGSGFDTLWPNLAALAFFGVAILWMSVQRFHKNLE